MKRAVSVRIRGLEKVAKFHSPQSRMLVDGFAMGFVVETTVLGRGIDPVWWRVGCGCRKVGGRAGMNERRR